MRLERARRLCAVRADTTTIDFDEDRLTNIEDRVPESTANPGTRLCGIKTTARDGPAHPTAGATFPKMGLKPRFPEAPGPSSAIQAFGIK